MLVLSRQHNEALQVGDDIRIVVVEIRNGRVRLGIEAPAHVSIVRDDAINREPRDRSNAA